MLAELENGYSVSCENVVFGYWKFIHVFNCMLLFHILWSPDLVKTTHFVHIQVLDLCLSCFSGKAGISKKYKHAFLTYENWKGITKNMHALTLNTEWDVSSIFTDFTYSAVGQMKSMAEINVCTVFQPSVLHLNESWVLIVFLCSYWGCPKGCTSICHSCW